jgi:hypothetical protein
VVGIFWIVVVLLGLQLILPLANMNGVSAARRSIIQQCVQEMPAWMINDIEVARDAVDVCKTMARKTAPYLRLKWWEDFPWFSETEASKAVE